MSGSFFSKFLSGLGFGGTNPGGASRSGGGLFSARPGTVSGHFAHLGKLNPTLPSAIANYVGSGANHSIILTLQQQNMRNHWQSRVRSYGQYRDKIGMFSTLTVWQPEQMHRLGEVLAAIEPITHNWGGHFGTKKSPDWLRHVVTEWLGQERKNQPIDLLQRLVAHGGLGVDAVMDILFCRDAATYGARNSVGRFGGVAEWLDGHQADIMAAAPALAANVRADLLASVGRFGLHRGYLPALIDGATGPTKSVRTAARQALTGADKGQLATAIAYRFSSAAPGQRAELVEVAATCLGAEAAPLLVQLKEGETVPKVLAAFDRTAGATGQSASTASKPTGSEGTGSEVINAPARPDGPEGYLGVDGQWIATPPLSAPVEATPIDPDVLSLLEPVAAEFNQIIAAGKTEVGADNRWHWSKHYSPKGSKDIADIGKLAAATWLISSNQPSVNWLKLSTLSTPGVSAFFNDPRLTAWHLARLALGLTGGHMASLSNDWGGAAVAAIRDRLSKDIDIRDFVDAWVRAHGADPILTHMAQRWTVPMVDLGVPIWTLLCQRFARIDEALGMIPQSGKEPLRMAQALPLLALFPTLPERYRPRLMMLAHDSAAGIRKTARGLLQGTPGLGEAIARTLADGRQDIRAQAAEWLAQRGEREQIAAIRAAVKGERSDVARAAMITALERLGDDVTDFFNTAAMVKDAKAGLAKAAPKGLEWIPVSRLPALHWANGDPVDPVLPHWWLVLAAKLKQPGGNALIDLWLDRLAPGDAHKLGWLALTGWIDEDTRCPTEEEANAYAAAHVDALLQQNISYAKRWPQAADYYITDRDRLFAQIKRQQLANYVGSAAASKGVLALTSRVNGADAAARVRAFLKDHGARVSQAKALIDVLGSIGTSTALQVVLAAVNRSKQRSVQAHAAALIEAIAERNGWTPAQLADRTIPTGGLEADGTLDLECGEGRTYRIQLDAQDNVVLLNPDGKEVKSLPTARIDDEKPLIDAAKKLLVNARKEVKQVLTAQADRLKEAMCFERVWPREDWLSFVAGHPVVGRLAARLIWTGLDAQGEPITSFRPLGDGSYSDAGDNDVDLSGFASIRLIHASQLDKAAMAAWRQHLADYGVEPPFDQIGRDLPLLTDAMRDYRSITDRRGWMIETFKLRGVAGKLGYVRGPAGDGGWFMSYERPYREAGIIAEIEFTGSPLPEENISAALHSLSFRRMTEAGHGGGQILLKDVPSVLLSESWQDLYDIAAKGSGFDAEWEKRASY